MKRRLVLAGKSSPLINQVSHHAYYQYDRKTLLIRQEIFSEFSQDALHALTSATVIFASCFDLPKKCLIGFILLFC